MSIITKAQLENAAIDAQTLEDVVNGSATPGTLDSRLETPLKTLAKIIDDLANQDIGASAATQINEEIDLLRVEINDVLTQITGNFFNSEFDEGLDGWAGELFANNQTLSFSGGHLIVTRDVATSSAVVDARGLSAEGYDFIAGTSYTIEIEVVSLDGPTEFRDHFSAANVTEALSVGANKFDFEYEDVNNPWPIIVNTSGAIGDQYIIESIKITEKGTAFNAEAVQVLLDELVEELDGLLATFDFEDGTDQGWQGTLFSNNQTVTVSNGQLVIESVTSSASVSSNNIEFTFEEGKEYELIFDVASLTGVAWKASDQYSSPLAETDLSVGLNSLKFFFNNPANGQTPGITARNNDGVVAGDEIVINSITIKDATKSQTGYDPNEVYVWLGENAANTVTVSNDESVKGVIVGSNAKGNTNNPVIIGNEADGVWVTSGYNSENVHGAASNNELVAIGNLARGGGWRTTAIGAKAHAMGQSSTALGTGAVALASHSVAIGRGSYVPDHSQLAFVGLSAEPSSLYMGNGWSHKRSLNYSEIALGDKVPTNEVIEYHGQDAYDARYPEWSNSTNYSAPTTRLNGNIVQHNDAAYKSRLGSGPASSVVEPGVTTDWEDTWYYMHGLVAGGYTNTPPGDYNVDGGHARLIAGRATGTGTGGTSGLSVTDGTDRGQNVKQTIIEGLYVDSDSGSANTYICGRKTDGTEFRLNLETDGTITWSSRTDLGLTYESNALDASGG